MCIGINEIHSFHKVQVRSVQSHGDKFVGLVVVALRVVDRDIVYLDQ